MVRQFNSGSERAHSHPTHIDCLLVVIDSRTLDTAYPWNPETEISVCGRLKTRFWCLEIKLGYFEGKMTPGQFGNVRSCYCRNPAPLSRHLHGPNSRSSTESNLTWLVNIHTVASLVLSSFNQDPNFTSIERPSSIEEPQVKKCCATNFDWNSTLQSCNQVHLTHLTVETWM